MFFPISSQHLLDFVRKVFYRVVKTAFGVSRETFWNKTIFRRKIKILDILLLIRTLLRKHSGKFWSSSGIGQNILWRLSFLYYFSPEEHIHNNKTLKMSGARIDSERNCYGKIMEFATSVSWATFWEHQFYENFFSKIEVFAICLKLFRKVLLKQIFEKNLLRFQSISENFSGGLSKLHSTSPEELNGRKKMKNSIGSKTFRKLSKEASAIWKMHTKRPQKHSGEKFIRVDCGFWIQIVDSRAKKINW